MTTSRQFDAKTYDTLTNQDTNPFADKRSPTIEEEDTPQVIHVVPETSKGRSGKMMTTIDQQPLTHVLHLFFAFQHDGTI